MKTQIDLIETEEPKAVSDLNYSSPANRNIIESLSSKEELLSDTIITPDGINVKKIIFIEIFKARVINMNNSTVTLECIIDSEKSTMQERIFPAYFFDNKITINSPILLTQRVLKDNEKVTIEHTIENAKGIFDVNRYFNINSDMDEDIDFTKLDFGTRNKFKNKFS